jgi:UDP-N-acetylmuramoylalanine-D-glutamate ligase
MKNYENILAAVTFAKLSKIRNEDIDLAIKTFNPLPNRWKQLGL